MTELDTLCKPTSFQRALQTLGMTDRRNLFWYAAPPRNYGDWIGPYLYRAFSGKAPLYTKPRMRGRMRAYFTVGSILEHIRVPGRVTVWGSGCLGTGVEFACPERVLAVRGPRSRDLLHSLRYPTSEVFGDPAILMPLVFQPSGFKRWRLGLIPHVSEYALVREAFDHCEDVRVIDLSMDVESVTVEIAACEAALASALHGLILSHAYQVPCGWISTWTEEWGDGRKFHDYFEAGGSRNVTPLLLEPNQPVPVLERMATEATRPDNSGLMNPLLSCCPFPFRAGR